LTATAALLPFLLALALDAGPAPAAAPQPPPALACLARHYAVRPVLRDGAWFAALPDGRTLAYDDGRAKSFDERLAAADLEDMFSIAYRPGPIRAVTTVNDDPGRIRVDAIFAATYGERRERVDLVPLRFLDQPLRVHRRVAPAFTRVAARLGALLAKQPALRGYLTDLGGTFSWRNIAGTQRPSAHSYGVSLDINVKRSHYWRWQKPAGPPRWRNDIPQAIVDAFEAEGFIWGGRWYHYDTMHFEYRPELLDPACYPGGTDARTP
jgi:hypothetical protein